MIDIDNTYIPDELVYNDAFEVDLKDCKRVDKPTTTTTINNDVLNNVKEWLLNNLGKKTTSTVYFKGIMAKYNYTYQTVLNAVKKLNEDGIINYL